MKMTSFNLTVRHLDADDLEEVVEKLFVDGLEDLYTKAGARKFLLIDVPPKDRSPSGKLDVHTVWTSLPNISAY